MQTLLGMRNLNFAGLRKRFAFRYSWHWKQGSRHDSAPGMTKSSLVLILGTLEGLPCTAGRSLLECKVTGSPQGSAHQGHERGVTGLPGEASFSSPAGQKRKAMAQVSVQIGCLHMSFGAVEGCGAVGSVAATLTYLCEQDPCISTSS